MTLKTVRSYISSGKRHAASPVSSQNIVARVVSSDARSLTVSGYSLYYRYTVGADWSYRTVALPTSTYNFSSWGVEGSGVWQHGLNSGDRVMIKKPTKFSQYTALVWTPGSKPNAYPPNLSEDAIYYVVNPTLTSFQVSERGLISDSATVDPTTDTITTPTSHGLADDDEIIFFGLRNTAPIDDADICYVKYVDDTTFQVAITPGGAAVDFSGTTDTDVIIRGAPLAHGGSAGVLVHDVDSSDNPSSPWLQSSTNFPVNISYRVASSDNTVSSAISPQYTEYFSPEYDVWYRFVEGNYPSSSDTYLPTDWVKWGRTVNTFIQPQEFPQGPVDRPYVQFAICGADDNFYISNDVTTPTGNVLDDPPTTAITSSATITVGTDTISTGGTLHGLSNNDYVSFSGITTATNIANSVTYFVVYVSAGEFKVASTEDGKVIDIGGTDDSGITVNKPEFSYYINPADNHVLFVTEPAWHLNATPST